MTSILHISPTHFSRGSVVGGGEKYILYLDKAIRTAASELGCCMKTKLLSCAEIDRARDLDGVVLIPGKAWLPHSVSLADYQDIIRHADIVIVHQCLTSWGLLFSSQARRLGKIVFGFDHGGGEHPLVHHSPEIGDLFDVAISYSEFGLKAFADLNCRKRLIRGPIDVDQFSHKVAHRKDRAGLRLLTVGRIMPHKGFEHIIDAMPIDAELTIIGSAYDKRYLSFLRKRAEGRQVSFLEDLDDREVANAYVDADLYVHSSTHVDYKGTRWEKPELLGLAPLEALASGTPVIVSGAGSLPELCIVDGCETFTDDAALARQLANANETLFRFEPHQIRASVEKHFGCLTFGTEFLRLVEECLA